MTTVGMAKTAIAFTVGVALALGGVGLYTRFAPHGDNAERATAVTPAVPDSVQSLPDDDSPPPQPPVKPEPSATPAAKPEPAASPATPVPAKSRVRVALARPLHNKQQHRPAPVPVPKVQPVAQLEPPMTNPYPAVQQSVSEPQAPETQPQLQPEAAPVPAATEQLPAAREPRTVTIPAGTELNVRLNQTLSSDHNFAGDTFAGTLESPIVLDNALIADRGSKVAGKVVAVQRGGRADSASGLTVTLTQINTTDGQRVHVQTSNYDARTTRDSKKDAEKIGGGAALGAIIGALAGGGKGAAIGAGVGGAAGGGDVLLTHGRPAVLQAETQVGFRITAPVSITEQINNK